MDEQSKIEKKAPPGKWRVIKVQIDTKEEWLLKDCDTRQEAYGLSQAMSYEKRTRIHIYNDQGGNPYTIGEF
ncbi:MAG: hypothetical protein HZA35_02260 [Parcubacteria group bacterium]|nr:hypothetical protein [Parcubacteria group bacterium]